MLVQKCNYNLNMTCVFIQCNTMNLTYAYRFFNQPRRQTTMLVYSFFCPDFVAQKPKCPVPILICAEMSGTVINTEYMHYIRYCTPSMFIIKVGIVALTVF